MIWLENKCDSVRSKCKGSATCHSSKTLTDQQPRKRKGLMIVQSWFVADGCLQFVRLSFPFITRTREAPFVDLGKGIEFSGYLRELETSSPEEPPMAWDSPRSPRCKFAGFKCCGFGR